jgi:LptA/(LptD N-terminal domain) LPS transport protein
MTRPSPPSRLAGPVLVLALILVACATFPSALTAQEGCEFGPDGNYSLQTLTLAGGNRITYVSHPHFICDDDVEIWADSAVSFSAQRMSHLLGSVRYIDGTRELLSQEARYFSQQGRLQAYGDIFLRDTEEGSEIRHGDLVYLRRTDFRDDEQITVTVGPDQIQPSARLFMRPTGPDSTQTAVDSLAIASTPPPDTARIPYVVNGNRIFLQGNSYFRATGKVTIDRDSLHAVADSAEYDQVAGRMLLQGSAKVEGSTYDLTGSTINLGMQSGDIDRVRAVEDAVLTGKDLTLTAPEIQLFLADGLLDRLVAVRGENERAEAGDEPARPVAVAEDFQLSADSLEVIAPNETLERIFAAGTARSVSHARDSLNVESLPEIARSDWLEGDTVVVIFEPDTAAAAVEADTTASKYRVDRITARGSARSLYRLLPSDSTVRPGIDPPAVHYVLGDSITIDMEEGEVEQMHVVGETRGVHLEPLVARPVADSAAIADSLAAADSARIDTTGVADPPPARPRRSRPPSKPSGTPNPPANPDPRRRS